MIGRDGSSLDNPSKGKILLVEDDFYIRSLYLMELESRGFKVYEASDAAQARNILSSGEVNLILLDVMLPGERGIELLEWLRKQPQYREVKIVMLSNVWDDEVIERAKSLGATDYLLKARTTPQEVANRVVEMLKGSISSSTKSAL